MAAESLIALVLVALVMLGLSFYATRHGKPHKKQDEGPAP